MKTLCNLYLHFARQDGQDRKISKENHGTKVTKIWDEQNNTDRNFVDNFLKVVIHLALVANI